MNKSRVVLVAVVTLLLYSALFSGFTDAESPVLQASPSVVEPGKPVQITFTHISQDTLLAITNGHVRNEFRNASSPLRFIPKEKGAYSVRLFENGLLAAETSFEAGIKPPSLAKTDFLTGEKVFLLVNSAYSDASLQISGSSSGSLYRPPLPNQIVLTFKEPGLYTAKLVRNSVTMHEISFNVYAEGSRLPALPVHNATTDNQPDGSGNLTQAAPIPSYQPITRTAISAPNLVVVKRDNAPLPHAVYELKEVGGGSAVQKVRAFGLRINVEIELNDSSITSVTLNQVDLSLLSNLQIDDSIPESSVGIASTVKRYAIDPGGLDFQNGSFTSTAKGNSLYKCKDWNFSMQQCQGAWSFVRKIQPGQSYDVELGPDDPAYAETGVATINTNKSAYHPGEPALITIVVLNTEGHLISGAEVSLNVTRPDNESFGYASINRTITEVSQGVYQALFENTSTEGNYTMYVTAYSSSVNSSMISSFGVHAFYPFDIIRRMPVTTDPFQAAFNASITLVSFTNATQFTFIEQLPSNFSVIDSGGASVATVNETTYLTWTNLGNNSAVNYTASPPNVTPYVWELGPARIDYDNDFYLEERPWILAVDPLIHSRTVYGAVPQPFGKDGTAYWAVVFFNPDSTNTNVTAAEIDASAASNQIFNALTTTPGSAYPNSGWAIDASKTKVSWSGNVLVYNNSATAFWVSITANKKDENPFSVAVRATADAQYSRLGYVSSESKNNMETAQIAFDMATYPEFNVSVNSSTRAQYSISLQETRGLASIPSGVTLMIIMPPGFVNITNLTSTGWGAPTIAASTITVSTTQTVSNSRINFNFNATSPHLGGLYMLNATMSGAASVAGFFINATMHGAVKVVQVNPSTPRVSLNGPSDGVYFGVNYTTFNWTVLDDKDAGPFCNLTINNIINLSGLYAVNGTYTNRTVSGFNDGAYKWNATCINFFNNTNTSQLRTFTIDTTRPSARFMAVEPSVANHSINNVTVNWTYGDTNPDTAYANVTYPNGTLLGTFTSNFTLTPGNLPVLGQYNLSIFANDSAGNVNVTASSFTVQDVLGPNVSLISPSNQTYTKSTSAVFIYNVSDISDIRNCTLDLNNGQIRQAHQSYVNTHPRHKPN